MRERIGQLALYALVLALLAYSWMPDSVSVPNERTRVYQAVALVDGGTIAIDAPIRHFGKTKDVSKFRNKRFTDKAPGSGFLAAGVYAAARTFTDPGDWRIADLINFVRTWLMIPLGLLGFFLLRRALWAHGVSRPAVDIASLSWILGSAAFHYSTAVYGHQIVAVLFLFVIVARTRISERRIIAALQYLAIGLAAGLAGFTEYQSALWCMPLAALVVAQNLRRPERIAAFTLGAGVFVALLLLYNWCAYDDPFSLSYHHLSTKMQRHHSAGVAGVSLPSAEGFFGILFSAHRGLLATSPIFALSFPGLAILWRDGKRDLAILVGASFAGYLAFISSAEIWHGGWAYGPRLMVPILGALAIPMAACVDRFRGSGWLRSAAAGLGVFGIACFQLTHVTLQEFPTNCFNPIRSVVIPAYRARAFSPNVFSEHLGIEGYAGIVGALVLAGIAIGVVLWRSRQLAKRHPSPFTSFGIPAAITAILFGTIIAFAPAWTETKTNSFLKSIFGVKPPAAKAQGSASGLEEAREGPAQNGSEDGNGDGFRRKQR
jgi:hypothetical protein